MQSLAWRIRSSQEVVLEVCLTEAHLMEPGEGQLEIVVLVEGE